LLVVYGPAVLFLAALLWAYMRVRASGDGGGSLLMEMLYAIYVYLGVAALWYLASIAALLHSYLAAQGAAERNQVKWILAGAALATLPIGYSLYLAIFDPARFGAGAAAWPMFAASAFVTVAYAVSITRYGLMRIDQLLSSGAAYFLVSTLAAGLYYTVVFAGFLVVGSRFVEGPSLVHVLAVSTTAMLLMALMDVGRGRLMRAMDKLYRREKNQLDHTLSRMSQAVEKLVDPPTLARRMLHTAADLLSAPGGSVYLRQGEPGVYKLTDAIGPAPALNELSPGCPLVEALANAGTFRPAGPPSPARRQLAFLGGGLAQGLTHEGQFVGLLLLAARPNDDYRDEDVGLLAAFAQMTALALVSAEGHQTIDALNKELKAKVEKIAEQQRRILALQSQLSRKDEGGRMKDEPESGSPSSFILHPSSFPPGPVGSGVRMQGVLTMARRVAASGSAVLLRGESGTGKEVFARVLHEASPRAAKPFVKVHCAALSP
ncbi:MAG: sigma 54-interacting transcriptional regulator, partial [Gemmataceae bacterium]